MSTRPGFPSAKEERPWPRWSFGGRLFAIVLLFTSLVGFGVELPALLLVAALQASILAVSFPFGRSVQSLRLQPVGSAVLREGELRPVQVRVESPARWPLVGLEAWARGGGVQGRGALLFVAGGSRQVLELQLRGLRRGPVRELRLSLESRAPFGLLIHRRSVIVPADFLVLPRPRTVAHDAVQRLFARVGEVGRETVSVASSDGEFHSLVEMRPGEVERRVHPRLSARRGRKVRAVYRGVSQSRVHLLLDPRLPARHAGSLAAEYEEAIRTLAGLILGLHRAGVSVVLWERTERGFVVRAREHQGPDRFMVALARLEVRRSQDSAGTPGPLAEAAAAGRFLVVHAGLVRRSSLPAEWDSLEVGSLEFDRLGGAGGRVRAR